MVIAREGSGYRADCSLHLSSGVDLQAEGRAQEPYASFEQALDKIERRLAPLQEAAQGAPARRSAGARRRARLQVANYTIEAPDESEEEPAEVQPGRRRRRLADR